MDANIEAAVDEALNGMRRYLAALAKVHQMLQATLEGADVREEFRSTNACSGILQAFYYQLDHLGIPETQAAGWKGQLLSCKESGGITTQQYDAALGALAAGGRTARSVNAA
jgi:hypothetical protein